MLFTAKPMLAIYILVVAIFEAFGQSFLAWARKTNKIYWLFIGIACYSVVAYGLYMSYQYKGVGIVNALWSSLSIVLMVAIGHILFHERLSRNEWIGIGLIIAGILFINFNGGE